MSRLLFAAARGARVQYMVGYPNRWETFKNVMPRRDQPECRIYPDDEHLQYGPISTALRGVAANPSAELTCTDEFGTWALLYSDWCKCRDLASERDVSLFLLILSETLGMKDC